MASILYGVPQGSVLGPLLFLIYISYLDQAIKSCEVHHFADNTNLVHFTTHITRLKKYLSFDMNNLSYWLYANKISLHVQKSELLIFKHPKKDSEVKIKLHRKRLYSTDPIKYIRIRIDENLNWKHNSDIAIKLNRENALLFKIRSLVMLTH